MIYPIFSVTISHHLLIAKMWRLSTFKLL